MISLKLLSTLSICLAFGPRQTTQSHLQQVTDHLSLLSNLVSGISLQNSLMNNSITVEESIAEFWNVRSVGNLKQLHGFSVDENEFVSVLESITSLLANIGDNPTENGNDVKNGFMLLQDLKQNLNSIEQAPLLDSSYLKTVFNPVLETFPEVDLLHLEELKVFVVNLLTIQETPLENFDKNEEAIISAYNTLSEKKAPFKKQLTVLQLHSPADDNLKKVFAMKTKYKDLNPVLDTMETASKYNASFDLLRKLPRAIKYLETDAANLPILAKNDQTFSKLGKFLARINIVVKSLTFSDFSHSGVSSFVDGFRSIDKMFEGLKDEWLRSAIAKGDDVGVLEKELEPVKTFVSKMRDVQSNREEYRRQRNIYGLTDEFSNTLNNLAENAQNLSQTTGLEASIKTLKSSIRDLNPLPDNLDFDKFYEVHRWVKKFGDLAEEVDKAYAAMKDLITTGDLAIVVKLVDHIAKWNNKDETAVPQAKLMRDIEGFDNIFMGKLKQVINITTPNRELFHHVASKPNFNQINPIVSSLANTNLIGSLQGLTSSKYDADSIDTLLGFGINARLVRNNIDQLRSMESVIKNVKKLDKSVRIVKEVGTKITAEWKDHPKQSFLMKEELSEWAWELSQGVGVLQRISDVLQKKDVVLSVVSAIGNADLQNSGEVDDVWTDRQLESVRQMVQKVEHLDRQAKGKSNLKNIAEFLLDSSRFKGLPTESELFHNLSIALELSPDPNAQKYAALFSQFSRLDLNFARARVYLKTAATVIDPLQTFFDTFFAINGGNAEKREAAKAERERERQTLMIIIITVVAAVLALSGMMFVVLRIRAKAPFKDMATYDLMRYTQYNTVEQTPTMSCTKARVCLLSNNLETFTKLLQEGSYVDACSHSSDKSESMLHEAVRLDRIKFIEVLIKNGADVNFLNHDYETPLQLAQKLKKTDAMTAIEFYSLPELRGSIVKRLPKRLRVEDYAIFTDGVKEHEDLACFTRRFQHLCTIDVTRATHIVVKVDADEVYDVVDASLLLIFNQSILMADGWLKASARNKSTLKNNKNYRVTKLRFRERIFDSVLTIKDFFQRSRIPYLFGTTFSFMEFETKPDWSEVKKVCGILGARVVDNEICVPKLTPDEPLHDAVTRFAKNPALRSLYYTVNRTRLIMVHREEDSFFVSQHPTYSQLVLGCPPAYCRMTQDEIVIFLLTWEIVHPKLEKMKDKFKPLNNIRPKRRGDQ